MQNTWRIQMRSQTLARDGFARRVSVLVGAALSFLGVELGLGSSRAADWPRFLGPFRNGTTAEVIPKKLPADGPPQLWRARVGAGYSGPVVSQGKAILFHRSDNQEIIEAFDAVTGKSLWKAAYPATYVDDFGFDNGPRGTPVVDGSRVYAMGADGDVIGVNLSDGSVAWRVNARKQWGAGKGFFGMACSPLVDGTNVLLNIGGSDGAGIIALDRDTGRLAWKATDHEASYSAPVMAELAGGIRRVLFFTRTGLVGLDPITGRVHFEQPWRASMSASVNATAPLVIQDQVFLTSSYDVGGILLRMSPDKVQKLWSNDESLSSQFSSVVHSQGYLYGFHGRVDGAKPDLRCVALNTGKVAWSKDGYGPGCVLLVGGDLLVVLESGEVVVSSAGPKAFQERMRVQGFGKETRAMSAFAGGKLYGRDKQYLICLDFLGQ